MNALEQRKTIRRIVIFSILVSVVAWVSPLLGGSPSSPGIGFILWGIAPLLVSVLMRLVTRDWSDLGLKPTIGRNAVWYIISGLALPVVMTLTLLIGALISISALSEFSPGQYLQTALAAMPVFFIFAIFEEVGWRGYLAPKLASFRINTYLAAGLLALVWTAWHMPYLRDLTWVYSTEDLVSFIPRYYLVLFAFSTLYGEIRTITGTFWPAVFMHAITNAFAHPLAADYITVAEGMDYVGSVSTGLIMVVLTLLLGTAINRWRMRTTSSSPQREV